jgi:hypothetical protein
MKPEAKAKWRDPVNVISLAATLLVAGVGIYLSTRTVFEGAIESLLFAWLTAFLAAILGASNRDSQPAWRLPLALMLISLFNLVLALHFLRMF